MINIITPLFGGSSPRKRRFKYVVRLGRKTLSRHYTKRAALKARKSGCKVVPIGTPLPRTKKRSVRRVLRRRRTTRRRKTFRKRRY